MITLCTLPSATSVASTPMHIWNQSTFPHCWCPHLRYYYLSLPQHPVSFPSFPSWHHHPNPIHSNKSNLKRTTKPSRYSYCLSLQPHSPAPPLPVWSVRNYRELNAFLTRKPEVSSAKKLFLALSVISLKRCWLP